MLRCPISGEVVKHPVILPCYHIFDKDSIEKQNIDRCPVCNEEFRNDQVEDLDIYDSEAAPAEPHDFQSYIRALEDEWNANQEETRSLRLKLESLQKKLVTTL